MVYYMVIKMPRMMYFNSLYLLTFVLEIVSLSTVIRLFSLILCTMRWYISGLAFILLPSDHFNNNPGHNILALFNNSA